MCLLYQLGLSTNWVKPNRTLGLPGLLLLGLATSALATDASTEKLLNHRASMVPHLYAAVGPEGQDVQISGRVTDEKGEGMPGVNVQIKSTTRGTTTDANGNYRLRTYGNLFCGISYQ